MKKKSAAKKKKSAAKKSPSKKRANTGKFRVAIIESERGWGQRVDEILRFKTKRGAEGFVKRFNARNTDTTVPDWYMVAELLRD